MKDTDRVMFCFDQSAAKMEPLGETRKSQRATARAF